MDVYLQLGLSSLEMLSLSLMSTLWTYSSDQRAASVLLLCCTSIKSGNLNKTYKKKVQIQEAEAEIS